MLEAALQSADIIGPLITAASFAYRACEGAREAANRRSFAGRAE